MPFQRHSNLPDGTSAADMTPLEAGYEIHRLVLTEQATDAKLSYVDALHRIVADPGNIDLVRAYQARRLPPGHEGER